MKSVRSGIPLGLIALSMAAGFMRDEEKWPPPPTRPPAYNIVPGQTRALAHVNRQTAAIFQWAKAPRVRLVKHWSAAGALKFASWLRNCFQRPAMSGGLRQNVVRPLIYDTLNFKMPPRCRASSLNHYFMVTQDHLAVRQRQINFKYGGRHKFFERGCSFLVISYQIME